MYNTLTPKKLALVLAVSIPAALVMVAIHEASSPPPIKPTPPVLVLCVEVVKERCVKIRAHIKDQP